MVWGWEPHLSRNLREYLSVFPAPGRSSRRPTVHRGRLQTWRLASFRMLWKLLSWHSTCPHPKQACNVCEIYARRRVKLRLGQDCGAARNGARPDFVIIWSFWHLASRRRRKTVAGPEVWAWRFLSTESLGPSQGHGINYPLQ